MDLTALVTIAHRRLKLRRMLMAIERDPGLLENDMTPKLRGLASAMAKLKHDVEVEADKLISRVEDTGQASQAAFAKSHQILDETRRDVADIEEFIASMVGSNGGPSGPLDGSSDSSEAAASQQPQGEPEKLTVNGVSGG